MTADTILKRLHDNAQVRPNAPAYYHKINGKWVSTSWATYLAQVRQAARALIALGFQPGDAVCILGFNRPEWVIMDVAGMLAGGAAAGIYTSNSPTEVQYVVDHAEARIVLVENRDQWAKLDAQREKLPRLEHIVMMQGSDIPDDPLVLSWEAFLAKADVVDESEVDRRLANLKPDQLATLIYTSGTTGPPKAVMLSHGNLSWTAQMSVELFGMSDADSSLSYLPLSHIAEQMFTIHGPITAGYAVYYAESVEKIADNLREVQPTIIFGVPRVWERFYNGVRARLEEAEGARAALVRWAQGVGSRMNDLRNRQGTPSGLLQLQYRLADRIVFSRLHEALGLGRARFCVSGAAPISPEILEFFSSLDIPILEVYGQSEDCGPTTFNQPGRTRYGSVGPPFPGTEVKIADDGEILVRGPNVFMGYYKNEAATNETFRDGWLCSGDLGRFDEDGFLHITGRKKEIIITSGGKNIAPNNIEAALKNIELVADAIVLGDQRRFISALLTLDPAAAQRFAEANGLSQQNLHENNKVLAAIQAGVDEVNQEFARVEQVRAWRLLPQPFSIETGELTPTMKLKRRVVHQKHGDLIESMYGD